MSDLTPEATAQRVEEALEQGAAIQFAEGMTDRFFAEITWSIVGLPQTNEIVVIVKVGDLQLALADQSPLLVPSMAERLFGLDISDQRLAERLSEMLWQAHSAHLLAKVQEIRGG